MSVQQINEVVLSRRFVPSRRAARLREVARGRGARPPLQPVERQRPRVRLRRVSVSKAELAAGGRCRRCAAAGRAKGAVAV